MKDISWIQNLKLRVSYGETGSQAITAYQSLASFSTTSYVLNGSSAVALVPGRVPNPDLKWETTKQTDIGIDLSVLGGRISLVADYYYKRQSICIMTRSFRTIQVILHRHRISVVNPIKVGNSL